MVCFSFSFFLWFLLILTDVSYIRISLSVQLYSFQSSLQPSYLFHQLCIASSICNSSYTTTSRSKCHLSPLHRDTKSLLCNVLIPIDAGSLGMIPLLGHKPSHKQANKIDKDGPWSMEIKWTTMAWKIKLHVHYLEGGIPQEYFLGHVTMNESKGSLA